MESDGPKTEAGGEQGRTPANVVQFPRDWLGPRDELVPIGRSTYPESEQRREEHKRGEPASAPPAGPDAFWGEDSAQIHAVMPGPETGKRPGRLPPRRRGTDRPIAPDVAHGSRGPRFPFRPGDWLRPKFAFRPGDWLRSPAIRLAGGLLVVAACAVVALVRLGEAPAGHVNRARATGGRGPAPGVIADGPASGAIALALLRSNAAHPAHPAHGIAPAKRTGGSASRRRPHAVVHRRTHAPKRPARPTTVSVDTAAASSAPAVTTEREAASESAAPTPPSTGSSSQQVTSVAESPSSASTVTHPTSTTGSSSHHHASTARPAFAADGSLGPGSSPDG